MLVVVAIKYFTTTDTPTGTYNISLVSFKGGRSCTLFGGCSRSPEKIVKRWPFLLQILPGDDSAAHGTPNMLISMAVSPQY